MPSQPNYVPAFDHTAEFDPKDISDNKVFAMLGYLLGIFGIIISLLASRTSEYTMFHVRQALKFMAGVLGVIKIICFFQICQGKAKEPFRF